MLPSLRENGLHRRHQARLSESEGTPVFLPFPCGSACKESACNAGVLGLIPGFDPWVRMRAGLWWLSRCFHNSPGSFGSCLWLCWVNRRTGVASRRGPGLEQDRPRPVSTRGAGMRGSGRQEENCRVVQCQSQRKLRGVHCQDRETGVLRDSS